MYRRLRFCWIVEWRTSSIIWIAWPLCSSGFGHRAEQQRHRAGGGDFRQRDDGQEQLLPFQPALLHLAEHVAADRAVLRAVDPVVLLLLHREVGPEHLLERVLLLRLAERVVRAVVAHRRVVLGFPGELLDLLVGLGHALAAHRHPSLARACLESSSVVAKARVEGPVPWITPRFDRACVLSLRHALTRVVGLEGLPEAGEFVADPGDHLAVALGRGRDAERRQELGGGFARVTGLAKDRVQALGGQVAEDEVDDASGVVGLFARIHGAVHGPSRRRRDCIGHLNLRQCE